MVNDYESDDTMHMREFHNGLTVRELKKLIKDWPEHNLHGEDCKVWIETGRNLSSPVIEVSPLNRRKDNKGNTSADVILESGVFDE